MRTLKPIPGCLAIAFLLVSCQAPTAALTPTLAPQSNPHTPTAILQATPTTEKSITAAKAAPTPTQVVATATPTVYYTCLLYTSDAADDLLCVDLGGRRIIKK